jgi:hypothetical protein
MMMMTVFWLVTSCILADVSWRFSCACCPNHQDDNRGSRQLWNVAKLLPDYAIQQPVRHLEFTLALRILSKSTEFWVSRSHGVNVPVFACISLFIRQCLAWESTRSWRLCHKKLARRVTFLTFLYLVFVQGVTWLSCTCLSLLMSERVDASVVVNLSGRVDPTRLLLCRVCHASACRALWVPPFRLRSNHLSDFRETFALT